MNYILCLLLIFSIKEFDSIVFFNKREGSQTNIHHETISLFPTLKGSYVNTPFRVDETLEKNEETKGRKCLDAFIAKGGQFHHLDLIKKERFTLLPKDIVYPSCSAGFNRSQTLHAILSPFSHAITLFPPHATRLGFDPYNDQANWYFNKERDKEPDGFAKWAEKKRAIRFGFDHFKDLFEEENPTFETLMEIREYFDEYYFGPSSVEEDQKTCRRVYITFAQNTHVILYRLNQTNEDLHSVVVVSIDLDDCIGKPLNPKIGRNSPEAYASFSKSLLELIDFFQLDQTN